MITKIHNSVQTYLLINISFCLYKLYLPKEQFHMEILKFIRISDEKIHLCFVTNSLCICCENMLASVSLGRLW